MKYIANLAMLWLLAVFTYGMTNLVRNFFDDTCYKFILMASFYFMGIVFERMRLR